VQDDVQTWRFYVSSGTPGETYGYGFKILSASEIEVYVNGALTTNYALTGVGSESGGTVNPYGPFADGSVVFLRRVTPKTQTTDYVYNDAFGAESHEAALDKLTRMVQDLEERFSRAALFPVGLLSAFRGMLLPSPAPGQLLGFDSNGVWTTYPSAIAQLAFDPTSNLAFGRSTATVTASAGTAVRVASGLVPAGTQCIGVLYRCTTTWGASNGLASVALGYGDNTNRWGAGISRLINTQTNFGQFSAGWLTATSAIDVWLSAEGGLFDAAGVAVLTALWIAGTPE